MLYGYLASNAENQSQLSPTDNQLEENNWFQVVEVVKGVKIRVLTHQNPMEGEVNESLF